jgi:endonuclease YncB( thermonuclease family)
VRNQFVVRRRRIKWIVGIALLTALLIADHNGWLLVRQCDDVVAYHGVKAHVLRVIDGDTIEVNLPDSLNQRPATRIHLWGVNCPEPARPGRAAEALADEATAFVQSRANDQHVILWLESHQTRDAFGAVLAHVELPDGTKLNEELLLAGLAKAEERWPHTMLVRYSQCELSAKRKRLGIWSGKS